MNKKTPFLVGPILLGCAASLAAMAATKESTNFRIERAWFDSGRVYVLYEEKKLTQHFSLSDVHGTVSKENSVFRLATFLRTEIKNGKILALTGSRQANPILYKDSEFTVSAVGADTRISTRVGTDVLVKCGGLWNANAPMRWGKNLFYCGRVFDASGNDVAALPPSVKQEIDSELMAHATQTTGSLDAKPRVVFCISSEQEVLVSVVSAVGSIFRFGVWHVGEESLLWKSFLVEQNQRGRSITNGILAFSPRSFVFSASASGQAWARCMESGCQITNNIDGYAAYLLVDEQVKEVIALSLPNMTKPNLRVRLSKQ